MDTTAARSEIRRTKKPERGSPRNANSKKVETGMETRSLGGKKRRCRPNVRKQRDPDKERR